MYHSVTQYSETGKKLKTYNTTSDAVKDTSQTMSQIRTQYNGTRKYCFWYSHIFKNDIILRNGTIIKPEASYSHYEFADAASILNQLDNMGFKIVPK